MSFLDHARSAYRTLAHLAETLEPDPLGDLHRRLARIEQLLSLDEPSGED